MIKQLIDPSSALFNRRSLRNYYRSIM